MKPNYYFEKISLKKPVRNSFVLDDMWYLIEEKTVGEK